ncbi:hypothetical protein KTD31_02225 [Burkholderia multivorans]|jgi:hypothetical protein|uniref:hypothetical protein n=1 Tax=Burkholderia multivorans TaxID=87883 RepID=UPI001C24ED81|nr:hypothetical protein [Burkholderia multivorans]MBU9200222.1 hypothetical protein [Burkholderia multivorans]MDN8078651.1 hypothetical protein [Burkholderia multivorans]
MKELKAADRADFERLAQMLMDMAQAAYLSSHELSPMVVVMGKDPGAAEQPTYRFGRVPIAGFLTNEAGIPGEVVLAALIERLSQDPEVLVVGWVAEAWRARYTREARERLGVHVNPEDAPNREEVLLMNLRSADCKALKICPLTRDGLRTTVGYGELLFNPRTQLVQEQRSRH